MVQVMYREVMEDLRGWLKMLKGKNLRKLRKQPLPSVTNRGATLKSGSSPVQCG